MKKRTGEELEVRLRRERGVTAGDVTACQVGSDMAMSVLCTGRNYGCFYEC